MRNSIEFPTTEIYFNEVKKSKLIKLIVDNYFDESDEKNGE
jgi:hypothetical protein